MDFLTNGNVLLVGDGDFSFTVALSKYDQFQPQNITSSNLETEKSISVHAQAAKNMAMLKDMGVSVHLETDARDLHTHEAISKKYYDRIIFNFPLADRHNIKKNRSLLADFFLSCSHILSPHGRVIVTLCKGQGGTPCDQPVRSWHDSWQIVAMATNAGFLLQSVIPFDASQFPEYHSVGFRFQDKSFNTSGGLIHVFERADLIKDTDSGVRGTVTINGDVYSCSSYVSSKMKRDLLTEPKNPTFILRLELESMFMNDVMQSPCPSIVLPGFKSLAHIVTEDEIKDNPLMCEEDKREEKVEKERKNQDIFDKSQKSAFAHGVEKNPEAKIQKLMEEDPDKSFFDKFLPMNNEAVYVLIQTSKKTCDHNQHNEGASDKNEARKSSAADVNNCDDIPFYSESEIETSPVFHHRTSMLEHVPDLCGFMIDKENKSASQEKSFTVSSKIDAADSSNENVTHKSINSPDCSPTFSPSSDNGDKTDHEIISCSPCLVVSGQCMLPGPITKDFLSVKQEMMIIHQIIFNETKQTENFDPYQKLCASSQDNGERIAYPRLSSQVISSLNKSKLVSQFHTNSSFSLRPCDPVKIHIQGMEQSVIMDMIFLQSNSFPSLLPKVREPSPIGYITWVKKKDDQFFVTLLDLTALACQLWSIEDKRLLWCTQDKFLSQFHSLMESPLKPPCVFPMNFAHDLSFWENSEVMFDVFCLYDVIRNIADDLVVQVSLVDIYLDPISKQRSRCYRLHFESHFQALPYVISWKLQSRIRIEVSKVLGVTLR